MRWSFKVLLLPLYLNVIEGLGFRFIVPQYLGRYLTLQCYIKDLLPLQVSSLLYA
jgi:hypothetical protein